MKQQLINQFTKSVIFEEQRKNKITSQQITSTLITSALNLSFVNESCKSTGQVSKSQVIYRKLEEKSLEEIQKCFRQSTIRFLKLLRSFSRNRKFLVPFDTTKEAFYGDYSKAVDKIYLHEGEIAKESYFYYEFLTVSISTNSTDKFILDGIIVPQGCYIEDYVSKMVSFIRDLIPIELVLFDRGFTSWGIIFQLNKLNVKFMIFWKKQGSWYKPHFEELQKGEFKKLSRQKNYNRYKTNYKVTSDFVLINQLEYKEKTYDWIFATNVHMKSAKDYVKRYKKRWCIETIYRVTDKIRAYTTSTKAIIRFFLFMFTCFVYNIWRFFQNFLGEEFTLANFKVNMIIFLTKYGRIYPTHYSGFEKIAEIHL